MQRDADDDHAGGGAAGVPTSATHRARAALALAVSELHTALEAPEPTIAVLPSLAAARAHVDQALRSLQAPPPGRRINSRPGKVDLLTASRRAERAAADDRASKATLAAAAHALRTAVLRHAYAVLQREANDERPPPR